MAAVIPPAGGGIAISPTTRNRLLGGCGCLLFACLLCTMCSSTYFLVPWVRERVAGVPLTTAPVTEAPAVLPPVNPADQTSAAAPTAAPTIAPTAQPATTTGFNNGEALVGTLDDFGRKTRHSDRFALAGTIMDESYNPGEIIVGNSFAVHDNGFVSQNGCAVFYYQAPANGGRVRFVGYDGQFFEFNSGAITLNQAIAAMRTTLENAHGCKGKIQYHQLVRYGDPVKK